MIRTAIIGWLVIVMLAGCAQLGQFTSYKVSEQELTELVATELAAADIRLEVFGSSLPVRVSNVAVRIGPEQSQRIEVSAAGEVVVEVLGQRLPVNLGLTLAGQPRVALDEAAVYVEGIELRDSSIQAGALRINVASLSSSYVTLLEDWLKANPVYRFDKSDNRIRLLQRTGVTIEVSDGVLVLKPGN